MTRSCQYANYFGKPGTGFHSIRIFDVALLDVLGTLGLAYLFAILFRKDFVMMAIIMFLLGILVHELVCVKTKINKMIFD